MKKYRKKPIVIEAEQQKGEFTVYTLEGMFTGKPGDYLITGIKGEQYPCDKEIFEETYEELKWNTKQTKKKNTWNPC